MTLSPSPTEREQEIIDAYVVDDASAEHVAARYGMTQANFYRLLKRYRVPTKRARLQQIRAAAERPEPGAAQPIEDRVRAAGRTQRGRAPTPQREQQRRDRIGDRTRDQLVVQFDKLTPTEREEIRELRSNQHWTRAELMRRYGVLNGVLTLVFNESITQEESVVTEPSPAALEEMPEVNQVTQREAPRGTFAGRFDRTQVPTYPQPVARPQAERHSYTATVLQHSVVEREHTVEASTFAEAVAQLAAIEGVVEVLTVTRSDYSEEREAVKDLIRQHRHVAVAIDADTDPMVRFPTSSTK